MNPDDTAEIRRDICNHLIDHGLTDSTFMTLPRSMQVAILRNMFERKAYSEPR